MTKRIAIIGAGPCGLSALVAFSKLDKNELASKLHIVCFEKQKDWGGLWQYTDWIGTDEYGEPVHSGMYRNLFSNGPKECLEYADYTFDEHFGKPIGSYPPRSVLLDYITGRANKAGVRKYCRFQTVVRMITYNHESYKFSVTVHDLEEDKVHTEQFDHVIVSTGHFSVPNKVYFHGMETFCGQIIHAHEFRNATHYTGQNVLIIGRSYSAEDIASQCWKYGAKSITISYRSNKSPMGYKWPDDNKWQERPIVKSIDKNIVHFVDGSSIDQIDTIILCTGYLHHFPFLSEDLRLKTSNRLWPLGLYKGVVWEENPRLFYLGMQDQFYTFNMFDAQAWYVRDIIIGRITLPSLQGMQEDSVKWRQREETTLKTDSDSIWFQGDYVKELVSATDYYPNLNIDGINRTFEDWEHNKHESIMGYRDKVHKSLITGTNGIIPTKPWIEEMDDTIETFLSGGTK